MTAQGTSTQPKKRHLLGGLDELAILSHTGTQALLRSAPRASLKFWTFVEQFTSTSPTDAATAYSVHVLRLMIVVFFSSPPPTHPIPTTHNFGSIYSSRPRALSSRTLYQGDVLLTLLDSRQTKSIGLFK